MCLFLVSLQYFVQASHLCFAQKVASKTIHSFASMKQAGILYLKLFHRHHISTQCPHSNFIVQLCLIPCFWVHSSLECQTKQLGFCKQYICVAHLTSLDKVLVASHMICCAKHISNQHLYTISSLREGLVCQHLKVPYVRYRYHAWCGWLSLDSQSGGFWMWSRENEGTG